MSPTGTNAENPSQPEYGKKWKEENNFGCCPSCTSSPPPVCTTVTGFLTRANRSASRVVAVENLYNCPCQNSAPVSTSCGEVKNSNECDNC